LSAERSALSNNRVFRLGPSRYRLIKRAEVELKALEQPPPDNYVAPNGWPDDRRNLIFSYHADCRDTIELLVRTKVAIDKELLRLAESTKPLHTRYRAVYILAQRGDNAVVAPLDRMCKSQDVNERYVAWETYQSALKHRKLRPPKDCASYLALYEKEPDREVRESMESFFGAAKVKAAVKPLLASMRRNPGWAMPAIWSLGMIGDKSVVPAIIADFPESQNRHYHLEALGRLATPEAIDFLIDHLDEYGAVEALYEMRSKKALPALQRHLKKLEQAKGPDADLFLAATRIAIVRLSHEDCREALLKIAEHRKENREARWDALRALQEYDTQSYAQRILTVYKTDPDTDIKRICIWLLADSKAQGITEAMMNHALQEDKIQNKSDLATEYALLDALNKRLGTFFADMQEMRGHIRELRKK
jgi:HEAT repeat protein